MAGEIRIYISITVGGAVSPEDALDAHSLVFRADEALYQGTPLGRNNAVLFGSPPEPLAR